MFFVAECRNLQADVGAVPGGSHQGRGMDKVRNHFCSLLQLQFCSVMLCV